MRLIILVILMATSVQAKTASVSWWKEISGNVTAAKYLPCGSQIKVRKNATKNSWIIVKVVNYGPFVKNRLFDFSPQLFKSVFGGTSQGVGVIEYKIIRKGKCRIHRHDGTY